MMAKDNLDIKKICNNLVRMATFYREKLMDIPIGVSELHNELISGIDDNLPDKG